MSFWVGVLLGVCFGVFVWPLVRKRQEVGMGVVLMNSVLMVRSVYHYLNAASTLLSNCEGRVDVALRDAEWAVDTASDAVGYLPGLRDLVGALAVAHKCLCDEMLKWQRLYEARKSEGVTNDTD